jgi:ketosteroid isomerase-like protein
MRSQNKRALAGKNALVSLALVFGILMVLGFACGKSKDAKPVSADYFGAWTAEDGSTLTIRSDGSGDYRSGGTSVSGGTVEINEADKTLSITFVGVGPTFKIDKAPAGDQMKLDGLVYIRHRDKEIIKAAYVDPKSSDDLPAKSEIETLIKSSFKDFAKGVEDEDFVEFYDHSSSNFQDANSEEQIKAIFTTFIDKKGQTLPVLSDVQSQSAVFAPAPTLETENGVKVLVANGEFATKGTPTKFETKYVMEDGDWKVLKFKVKM